MLLKEKVQRYFKVTHTVSEFAARWAGNKYLGIGTNHDLYARSLSKVLGGLKGPLMKVVQLLSTIPGALPPKYLKKLSVLQSQAPSMGWLFVKRRMCLEIGINWESNFRYFSKKAFAAASLGQVHKGVISEGIVVACKLQYPNMEEIIKSDLKQLKIFLNLYENFNKGLNTSDVFIEISDRLIEEINYLQEAQNISKYKKIIKKLKNIYIPDVVKKLTTKRLLTMSWMEGESLLSFLSRPSSLDYRNKIAKNLFWAWYFPFYSSNIIHGDPHLGNYSIRSDGGINLLDFGCVRHFSFTFIKGVLELYKGLLCKDEKRCYEAYQMWGFKKISQDLFDVLNVWARFLYAPLLDNKVQTIDAPHKGVVGREVIGKILQELNKVGGVTLPREFVLMDRAAVGIGSALIYLKATLNWHEEFQTLLDEV